MSTSVNESKRFWRWWMRLGHVVANWWWVPVSAGGAALLFWLIVWGARPAGAQHMPVGLFGPVQVAPPVGAVKVSLSGCNAEAWLYEHEQFPDFAALPLYGNRDGELTPLCGAVLVRIR